LQKYTRFDEGNTSVFSYENSQPLFGKSPEEQVVGLNKDGRVAVGVEMFRKSVIEGEIQPLGWISVKATTTLKPGQEGGSPEYDTSVKLSIKLDDPLLSINNDVKKSDVYSYKETGSRSDLGNRSSSKQKVKSTPRAASLSEMKTSQDSPSFGLWQSHKSTSSNQSNIRQGFGRSNSDPGDQSTEKPTKKLG